VQHQAKELLRKQKGTIRIRVEQVVVKQVGKENASEMANFAHETTIT